jgi:methyltransferase family protein
LDRSSALLLETVSDGYSLERSSFSGASKPIDPHVGAAIIEPPPGIPWAYGAVLDVNTLQEEIATDLTLAVELFVQAGEVGIGILNASETEFLYRESLPAGQRTRELYIPVYQFRQAGRMVIQNWESGHASVRLMRLRTCRTIFGGASALAQQTPEGSYRLIPVDYTVRPQARQFAKHRASRILEALLARDDDIQRGTLTSFQEITDFLLTVPVQEPVLTSEPFWSNGWIPPLDAVSLCGLLRQHEPGRYIEIGSGNSTKFARKIIDKMGLRTKILSIDPAPRAEIDALCHEKIRSALEDLPNDFYTELRPDDMIFFDGSHRSFPNSDVTVFFTELLPCLPAGVIYGLHDIFLPNDYPATWNVRFYNEQYLLLAYLFGGGGKDEVLFASSYVCANTNKFRELDALWSTPALASLGCGGGCFWARRKPT